MYKQAQEWPSSMRILGGPCNVGSEPGPHKTGKVGMCVCVCVCVCMYVLDKRFAIVFRVSSCRPIRWKEKKKS